VTGVMSTAPEAGAREVIERLLAGMSAAASGE
jgi:hypothetical protein